MEGIGLWMLFGLSLYIFAFMAFFATLFFGFKVIKNKINGKTSNASLSFFFIFGSSFLFLAFIWPGNFQSYLQNAQIFRAIYHFQLSLLPASLIYVSLWAKKAYKNYLFLDLFTIYGVVKLISTSIFFFESLYKVLIGDKRPYLTGISEVLNPYMVQINILTTLIFLLAIYSLFATMDRSKSRQGIKGRKT